MKKNILLTLFIISVSMSCVSTQFAMDQDSVLDSQASYIAGNFFDVDFLFTLKNLDTEEFISFYYRPKDHIQISPIPIGRYAIVNIKATKNVFLMEPIDYYIDTPLYMLRTIYVNSNEILYLGDFARDEDSDSVSFFDPDGGLFAKTAGFTFSGDMDAAFSALQEQYVFSEPMDLVTMY